MDTQKADLFLMINGKCFESHHLHAIRESLLTMEDHKWVTIHTTQFKDPSISLILSLMAGAFGIDRFMIGDTGLGVGKLLTCGGFGIWTIIDWFLIMGATREKNMEAFQNAILMSK